MHQCIVGYLYDLFSALLLQGSLGWFMGLLHAAICSLFHILCSRIALQLAGMHISEKFCTKEKHLRLAPRAPSSGWHTFCCIVCGYIKKKHLWYVLQGGTCAFFQ